GQEADAEVRRLEQELRDAKQARDQAWDVCNAAHEAHEAALEHQKSIAAWQASIEAAANTETPTAENLELMSRKVAEARAAIEAGVRVRDAKASLAKAEKHKKLAAEAAKKAQRLRQTAAACDEVLTGIVADSGVPLSIVTDRDGVTRL